MPDNAIDFGLAATDYAKYRAGFPDEFFAHVHARRLIQPQARLLDIGSGTGDIARGMASRGCRTIALDIASALLAQARQLDRRANALTKYVIAAAEHIPFPSSSFDVVTAGQCWHWFDGIRSAHEIRRVLKPGGAIVIGHFDWLPHARNVAAATETLILRHNPDWAFAGGHGVYPQWLPHLRAAKFVDLETSSFDLALPYTHEAWRGRIRASAGVAASLSPPQVDAFDRDLQLLLRSDFPADPLIIPHRVFTVIGKKPA